MIKFLFAVLLIFALTGCATKENEKDNIKDMIDFDFSNYSITEIKVTANEDGICRTRCKGDLITINSDEIDLDFYIQFMFEQESESIHFRDEPLQFYYGPAPDVYITLFDGENNLYLTLDTLDSFGGEDVPTSAQINIYKVDGEHVTGFRLTPDFEVTLKLITNIVEKHYKEQYNYE